MKQNIWHDVFLDNNSFCMSINSKRYNYLCKNFEAVGLKQPRLFRGVRWNHGANTGCVLAHISIISMCRCQDYPYCIVFEDDAYPRPDVLQMWEKIKQTIPDDCGILKLGSSSYRGDMVPVNDYISYMKNGAAFGSHAYIIRKEIYDFVCMNMAKENVPESYLNWEVFKDKPFKPYVLNFNSLLFIQKNISIDNIIANKGGERYWYPSETERYGCTSGKPCRNFVDKLIDNDEEYLDDMSVVCCDRFPKKKKTAVVTNDRIYTKDESGTLKKICDTIYQIHWSDDKLKDEILRFERQKDGIKYYSILKIKDNKK